MVCVLEFGDVSIAFVRDSNLVESRRRESYILTPVSIPKVHHIIRLALAIIMNISPTRRGIISIYVKHVRFHGVSHAVRDNGEACASRSGAPVATHTRTHKNRAN